MLLLIILNPFGQMLYLSDLINRTSKREFTTIFIQATFLTAALCLLFTIIGEFLLRDVFHVQIAAVQIFGGIIILAVAYTFIMKGPEGIRLFQGNITEIAQQIALPLLVGPGVIWVSINIGQAHSLSESAAIIAMTLSVNGLMVFIYQILLKRAHGRIETVLLKYFAIAMRLNALMIGAVSVQMILSGIREFITA